MNGEKKYLELGITPRGLCIKKQCSFLDEDLTKEWHIVSEFCTTKWINIAKRKEAKGCRNASARKD